MSSSRKFVLDTAFGNMMGLPSGKTPTGLKAVKAVAYDVPKFIFYDAMWGGLAEGLGIRQPRPLLYPWQEEPTPEPDEPQGKTDNTARLVAYQYAPLQQSENEKRLRILELQPGTTQDDIVCGLREYEMSSAPPYEALSYCWGDANDITPIAVDESNLNITRSLRTALFYLRRTDQPRLIWADAVCINQQDSVERARQVSIMGDIYRNAIRTVVWLGPPNDETARAFTTCIRLAGHADAGQLKVQTAPSHAAEEDFDSNDSSVEHLVGRAWWSRIWVVQEVVLSKEATIVCGAHEMSWRTFHTAVEVGFSKGVFEHLVLGLFESDQFAELDSFRIMKEAANFDTVADRLLHLLSNLRGRHATNPRDKIFGCLGMVNDVSNELALIPDYDIPTEQVYLDTARIILTCSGNLNLLGICLVNQYGNSASELPSWVPDWRVTKGVATALGEPFQPRQFTATGKSRASPCFKNEGRSLILSGHLFDEIVKLGDALPDLRDVSWDTNDDEDANQEASAEEQSAMSSIIDAVKDLKDIFKEIRDVGSHLALLVPYLATFLEWEKLAAIQDSTPSMTGLSHEEVYWRTLCTDQIPDGYDETFSQYREWRNILDPFRSLSRWGVNRLPKLFKSAGFVAYLKSTWEKYPKFGRLMAPLSRRRLGRTRQGYLCLVPASAQIGDEIALLKGGRVPLVLRNQRKKGFLLVGEAFVLELMSGEAFNPAACHEIVLN